MSEITVRFLDPLGCYLPNGSFIVVINTPNGRAPPLVTGTFGGADFLHSLLGEAGE